MDSTAHSCLFCASNGPSSVEHVVPESLGNDDLVLSDKVCCSCNNHFSKLEEMVLQKTPLAFWRVILGIRTKRGKLPSVDVSQPVRQKGTIATRHPAHDDVGFSAHEDGSASVEIDNPQIVREILTGDRSEFRMVWTPKLLLVFGRFLCKVGVELLCLADEAAARSSAFELARRFARFGEHNGLWPIFHFSHGRLANLRRFREEEDGVFEDVDCFSYQLFEFDRRTWLQFGMGTDHWIVCLDEPFPLVELALAFPGRELRCLWYGPDQLNRQVAAK